MSKNMIGVEKHFMRQACNFINELQYRWKCGHQLQNHCNSSNIFVFQQRCSHHIVSKHKLILLASKQTIYSDNNNQIYIPFPNSVLEVFYISALLLLWKCISYKSTQKKMKNEKYKIQMYMYTYLITYISSRPVTSQTVNDRSTYLNLIAKHTVQFYSQPCDSIAG